MPNRNAKAMAFGGVTAALAVTLGCLAGMIPIATYVIPVLQCLVLHFVVKACGSKTAWVWYAAVSILSALLCPDKEAAAFFVFLGYYPIVKPRLDKLPLNVLWKLLLFLVSSATVYGLLIFLLGMEELAAEFAQMGKWLGSVTLILGCATFLLLDRLLTKLSRRGL